MTRPFLAVVLAGWALCGCAGLSRTPAAPPSRTASATASPGLPTASAPWARGGCPGIVVRPGDSLWRLSRRALGAGSAWPSLARANGLKPPYVLRVGERLKLPCGARAPGGARASAVIRSWPRVPDRAFGPGERLTFAVRYAGITAGYATLSVLGVERRMGRRVLHIQATARSQPFFDAFFRVRDVLDSYLDADSAFSWGYDKHLAEGRYRADASYVYDQYRGEILEPAKGTSAPMPPRAQDVLSCYYYFRDLSLTVGSTVSIPVTADDMKSYRLTVAVLGRQRVRVLAGTFDCLLVRPRLAFQGVLRQRGKVLVWVTDDARHIPVLIRSKIVIGDIDINLAKIEGAYPPEGRIP